MNIFKDGESLKDIIDQMIEKDQMGPKLKEARLVQNWEKLVGQMIAKHTDKMYVKNAVLYLHIGSAPLRQELNFQRSRLVEIVNEEMGAGFIKDINIR